MTAAALSRAALVMTTLVAVAASTVVGMALADYVARAAAMRRADPCSPVPMAPEFTVARDGTTLELPYGDVTACRVLDRRAHLFGATDFTAHLLLRTSSGPVLLDVSYAHTYDGAPTRVEAVEVSPDQAPDGLGDADRRSLSAAVARRGGVRPGVWILQRGQ